MGLPILKVKQGVTTIWNSTFRMLKPIGTIQDALSVAANNLAKALDFPSNKKLLRIVQTCWDRLPDISSFRGKIRGNIVNNTANSTALELFSSYQIIDIKFSKNKQKIFIVIIVDYFFPFVAFWPQDALYTTVCIRTVHLQHRGDQIHRTDYYQFKKTKLILGYVDVFWAPLGFITFHTDCFTCFKMNKVESNICRICLTYIHNDSYKNLLSTIDNEIKPLVTIKTMLNDVVSEIVRNLHSSVQFLNCFSIQECRTH